MMLLKNFTESITGKKSKTMTKEQEDKIRQEQKRVFDWMFEVQEERLKQRGYPCNDDGQRTLVIDLSCNKE